MSEYDIIEQYDIENAKSIDNIIKKKSKLKIICKHIIIAILFITIVALLYYVYNEGIDISESVTFNSTESSYSKFYINNYYTKNCDSYKYGCCDVIDNNNNIYILSINRIHKHDENGSNCPTFNKLVNNYVNYIYDYYSYKIINCIYHKCCDKYDIIIPVKKCPSSNEIVKEFNNGYENPYIIMINIIIVYIFVMYIYA
tara:strand:- start:569 stop:1165 length:597 start_codon:yes stop_codon:yes gene_type:complete